MNAFRFGVLGVSDVSVGFAFSMIRRVHAGGLSLRRSSLANGQAAENLTIVAGVLGQKVAAPDAYAPEVLEPIERLRPIGAAPFGWDVWHAYELSWCVGRSSPRAWAGLLCRPIRPPLSNPSL